MSTSFLIFSSWFFDDEVIIGAGITGENVGRIWCGRDLLFPPSSADLGSFFPVPNSFLIEANENAFAQDLRRGQPVRRQTELLGLHFEVELALEIRCHRLRNAAPWIDR